MLCSAPFLESQGENFQISSIDPPAIKRVLLRFLTRAPALLINGKRLLVLGYHGLRSVVVLLEREMLFTASGLFP